jgi:hypothetical protein
MASNGPGRERMKSAFSTSRRRLERGEQLAGAAAELEHPGARRNEKPEVAQVLVVEEGRTLKPVPALGRADIGEPSNLLLAHGHCAVGAA